MYRRFLILFLTQLSPLTAQEKESPAKSDSGVQVRLLAEEAPSTLGKVFFAFGEAKSKGFSLPTQQLSESIPAPSRVMILKTIDKEIPLCTINLPDAGQAFAVVLVSAKTSGYTPIIVRTDDPAFKAGDVFFINRSEKIVLGKLGTNPLVLKPGETEKTRPSGAVDNTYYDIAFATREKAGDKLISSSRWPVDDQLRSYVFFFTTAEGGTSFRAVDEFITPGAKP